MPTTLALHPIYTFINLQILVRALLCIGIFHLPGPNIFILGAYSISQHSWLRGFSLGHLQFLSESISFCLFSLYTKLIPPLPFCDAGIEPKT